MVFTPTKNAPLNVFDYKVERLLNFDRLNGATVEDLNYSKKIYAEIRSKLKFKYKLSDEDFCHLEILNKTV